MDSKSYLARTPNNMKDTFLKIKKMEANPNISIIEINNFKKSTGIHKETILIKLPSMIPSQCFPLDIMHLIILNIFQKMFTHWSRNFFKGNNNSNEEQFK
jgi:hypothetical protein